MLWTTFILVWMCIMMILSNHFKHLIALSFVDIQYSWLQKSVLCEEFPHGSKALGRLCTGHR